jgi:hypothetical protein
MDAIGGSGGKGCNEKSRQPRRPRFLRRAGERSVRSAPGGRSKAPPVLAHPDATDSIVQGERGRQPRRPTHHRSGPRPNWQDFLSPKQRSTEALLGHIACAWSCESTLALQLMILHGPSLEFLQFFNTSLRASAWVGSFHIRKVCPLLLAAHPKLAHAAEEEMLQTTTTNAKNNRMPEPPFLLETLQSNQAGRSKSNLVWIEPGDTHSTASQRTPRALAFGPSRSRLAYCSGWNGNGIGVLLASNHRRS